LIPRENEQMQQSSVSPAVSSLSDVENGKAELIRLWDSISNEARTECLPLHAECLSETRMQVTHSCDPNSLLPSSVGFNAVNGVD